MTQPIMYVGINGDELSEKAIKILNGRKCITSLVDDRALAPHLSVLFVTKESDRWPGRHVRHAVIFSAENTEGEERNRKVYLGVLLRKNPRGDFEEAVLNAARTAETLLSSHLEFSDGYPWLTDPETAMQLRDAIYESRRVQGSWDPTEGLKIQKKPKKRDRSRTKEYRRTQFSLCV